MVPNKVLENIRPDEAIVYEAKKNTEPPTQEFIIVISIITYCSILFAVYVINKNLQNIATTDMLILIVGIPIFFIWNFIILIKDRVYLTNQRLIIYNKFTSKITSFELDEIDTFDVIHDKRSKYILIGKKRKSTIIRNIKVDELEAEFKKLRPDFKPKGFSLF